MSAQEARNPGAALRRLEQALEAQGSTRGKFRKGNQFWTCPAHDDHTPSLSVKQTTDGVLVRCFAGCEAGAIVSELGLTLEDLFDVPRKPSTDGNSKRRTSRKRQEKPAQLEQVSKPRPKTAPGGARPTPKRVAEYVYLDSASVPLRRKVRFEPAHDGRSKSFLWEKPTDEGWESAKGDGNPEVLYRLPELLDALLAGDRVFVCAGEKDADRVHREGWPATTNPEGEGVGKWRPEYSELFQGSESEVRVVADRDRTGYPHAAAIVKDLQRVGVKVRCVESLVDQYKADVSDHLDAGHDLEALVEIDPGKRALELDESETLERGPSLDGLGFSGAKLLALLDRQEPEPVVPGLPTAGHLTLEVAPPFTGKTSLSLWTAMARAAGVAPWEGAPAHAAGRVLLFSIDEAPEQVVRRMRGLATFHPAGLLEKYADNLVVLGPDRDVDPAALDALRFDPEGLAVVATWLRAAAREGRPFVEVYVDAYADVLPYDATENSNETATQIGGALERLAVETGAAITLLHHSGKPKQGQEGPADVTHLARGASALAAKARVITSLEAVAGMPELRRIRTKTNLGRTPPAVLFSVCDANTEDQGESLFYFRPHDPLQAHRLEDLLKPGEILSTRALARRIARVEEDEEPSGEAKRIAAKLREQWRKNGQVVVTKGSHNALCVSLPGGGKE